MKSTKKRNEAPLASTLGASHVFTIYCHTHIESGRRYIGLTSQTMMQRWKSHVSHSRNSKGGRWYFPNAIRKYGKDTFSHEVLEICDTLDSANSAEEKWIEFYDTTDITKGFNLSKGGHNISTLTPSQRAETTKKLWQNPEYREKVTMMNRITYSDPIVKDRVVQAMKESFSTPESRTKRSLSSQLMWQSEEYRARNIKLWTDPEFRSRCQSGLVHGASLNKIKTHCPHGHEYSVKNTVINSKGSRECLICQRKLKHDWYEQRKVMIKDSY